MDILHCDLNNFYASVEQAINPQLKGKFVAVSGNPATRSGIILAKNTAAKQMGVKTGEAIWEAKQKCPQLVCVPPHFEYYSHFSKRVREFTSSTPTGWKDSVWTSAGWTLRTAKFSARPLKLPKNCAVKSGKKTGAYHIGRGIFHQNVCQVGQRFEKARRYNRNFS